MSLRTRLALDSRFAVLAAGSYLLLATLLLALYWWPEAKALAGDEVNYQHRAIALLAGGDRFDALLIWPPLQWLFMAVIYQFTGPHILAVQIVQLGLLAISGVLLRQIVWRLTGNARIGNWAGVLLAVNPLSIAFATFLWPEITHLFFSLVLAFALTRLWRGRDGGRKQPEPDDWRWAALAGAALGLCLLAKSLLSGFWPLLLLPLLVRGDIAGSLRRMIVFCAAALVVTGPALHHGWQLTGKPTIADSSWFNLWVGLQDRWRSDFVFDETGPRMAEYLAAGDTAAERNAFAREQAMAIVREQGVVGTVIAQVQRQYFRLFDARNQLVTQLPGPACRGYQGNYRIAEGALSRSIDVVTRVWHVTLLVLFALGLAAWRDWRSPWLWLTLAFVGYQLALLAGLHVKTRFLLPMLPVICLFAAHLLVRIGNPANWLVAGSPWPRRLGLLLALLLVVLASAGPALDRACEQPPAAGDLAAEVGKPEL